MSEIKMNDPDLREIASALRYLAGREDECSSNRRKWGEIAAAIEEQVKPVIDEPREFGSIVSAPLEGERVLWTSYPPRAHYWIAETGFSEVWSGLTDVEVLRVGLGDPRHLTDAEIDQIRDRGIESGSAITAGRIHNRLQKLLAESITSERKNALEKAIQAVEELAP